MAEDDLFEVETIPGTLVEATSEGMALVEILMPFIHSTIGRAEMDKMPRLRLIATRSTGYNHVDLAYATERKIAVAEYTFALLLTLTRKILMAATRTQHGGWFSNALLWSTFLGMRPPQSVQLPLFGTLDQETSKTFYVSGCSVSSPLPVLLSVMGWQDMVHRLILTSTRVLC